MSAESDRSLNHRLCGQINAFWHKRGADAGAFVASETLVVQGVERVVYFIRSDLVNGWPPR